MKTYQFSFSYKSRQSGMVCKSLLNLEAYSLENAKKICLKTLHNFYCKEYVKDTLKFEKTVGSLEFW